MNSVIKLLQQLGDLVPRPATRVLPLEPAAGLPSPQTSCYDPNYGDRWTPNVVCTDPSKAVIAC